MRVVTFVALVVFLEFRRRGALAPSKASQLVTLVGGLFDWS
jgi:hypothetical protein